MGNVEGLTRAELLAAREADELAVTERRTPRPLSVS